MFDTHLHLTDEAFANDRAEVIARARAAGVAGMLTMATDLASSRAAVAIAESEPDVFAAVGIHPCDVAKAGDGDFDEVARMARARGGAGRRIVAIGETGLDYYWDASTADLQKTMLRRHLELARELDLPIILHNRNSHDDLIALLDDFAAASGAPIRGVLHCFSGSDAYREAGLRLGLYIGFGGPLTYKKSAGPEDIRKIPRERLLLETDAPYLPPAPHRGKRNEPAYIALVLARAAEVLERDLAELDAETSANARRLFCVAQAQ
jgi:TatD DNase family protein